MTLLYIYTANSTYYILLPVPGERLTVGEVGRILAGQEDLNGFMSYEGSLMLYISNKTVFSPSSLFSAFSFSFLDFVKHIMAE